METLKLRGLVLRQLLAVVRLYLRLLCIPNSLVPLARQFGVAVLESVYLVLRNSKVALPLSVQLCIVAF